MSLADFFNSNIDLEFWSCEVVYCDAVLSDDGEAIIRKYIEINKTDVEFNLSDYVDSRIKLYSVSMNQPEINTIIGNLEVSKGKWAVFPPRQTGVDIVISAEIMSVLSSGHGIVILISKDGGFEYAINKLKGLEHEGFIANLSYAPNGYSKILRSCSDISFEADLDGNVLLREGDVRKLEMQEIELHIGGSDV